MNANACTYYVNDLLIFNTKLAKVELAESPVASHCTAEDRPNAQRTRKRKRRSQDPPVLKPLQSSLQRFTAIAKHVVSVEIQRNHHALSITTVYPFFNNQRV